MKRCSRCQAVYTDEVRWCPADGTPTEDVASSPAALAAAANHIPEGAPTLHDMPAVGPGTAGWNAPEVPRAPTPNATMIGAPSPLPRMPSSPPSDKPVGAQAPHHATMIGATSPVRQPSPTPAPPIAPYSPTATMIGPQASTSPHPPVAYPPNATTIGAPSQPAATASSPNPLNATMIGGVSPFAQRGPALATELAKIASTLPSGPPNAFAAGPHGPSTIQGSPEVRAPATPSPLAAPSTVPGALIPPIQSPLMSTFTGTTSEPPRTPHGSPTSPADLGPQGNTFLGAPSPVPRAPAPPSTAALAPPSHSPSSTSEPPRTPPADLAASHSGAPTQPVAPAAHIPGPVSQGWDVPDLPAGSSTTGTPAAISPAALVAAATMDGSGRPNSSTLPGFAPSPELLRAIQEQRAKIAAQQTGQTQPMAAPVIAAEAYIPSGSESTESYVSMAVAHATAMTAVGSATDPVIATPIPVNSTLPALSPLPMQPAVVVMASQQPSVASAISQAPLPSMSMPHAVAPVQEAAVVVSHSMTMAAAQLPSAPKPPTASLLEAPPFQAAAAAAAKPSTARDTDKHRAVDGNKTLWIVFAVIAVAMIGATIAILVTRS